MFISQVIFESEKENEALLRDIMRKKMAGLASAECWRQEGLAGVGHCLVTKWDSMEQFKAWMAQLHSGGHRQGGGDGERPAIRKTAFQFEAVEDLG